MSLILQPLIEESEVLTDVDKLLYSIVNWVNKFQMLLDLPIRSDLNYSKLKELFGLFPHIGDLTLNVILQA